MHSVSSWVMCAVGSCYAFPLFFMAPWVPIFVTLCKIAMLMLWHAFLSPGVELMGGSIIILLVVYSSVFAFYGVLAINMGAPSFPVSHGWLQIRIHIQLLSTSRVIIEIKKHENYARMKAFVRRSSCVPFRQFLGDVRRSCSAYFAFYGSSWNAWFLSSCCLAGGWCSCCCLPPVLRSLRLLCLFLFFINLVYYWWIPLLLCNQKLARLPILQYIISILRNYLFWVK
jgi:hypothetical protein